MASDLPAPGTGTWRIGRAAAGALGLIFAILYLFEGRNLSIGRMAAPGPGIYPLIVGVIFALVCLGVIADALLTRNADTAKFPKGENLKQVIAVFAAFVVYVATLNVVGFLIGTVALVTFYTRIVGKISRVKAALCGFGVTLLIWGAFVFLLGVRLPSGIWS